MQKKSVFILLLGIAFFQSTALSGQMERFRFAPDGWKGFVLKPEIEFFTGISIPRGKFGKLGDVAGENGAAGLGYFGELRLVQRGAAHPLWNMRLSVGYMQHSFKKEAVINNFALDAFTVDNWTIAYLMPGLGFRGGKLLKFEIHASAGLFLYNGWNARRGVLDKLQNLHVYSWDFKQSIGGALCFGGQLGYKITNRCFIFAEASVYLGSGQRQGNRYDESYKVDTATMTAVEPPLSSITELVRNKAIFSMVHLGMGLRYVLYKHLYDPNDRYKNYY